MNPKLYEVAGFKVAGKRAVRVDILERLADIIRPLIALDPKTHQGELPAGAAEGNGFRVTVEMTSLLGTAGEDFASILNSLGYRVRRTPKVAGAGWNAEAIRLHDGDAAATELLPAADAAEAASQRSGAGCRCEGASAPAAVEAEPRARSRPPRSRPPPPISAPARSEAAAAETASHRLHGRSRRRPSPSSTKSGSPAVAGPTMPAHDNKRPNFRRAAPQRPPRPPMAPRPRPKASRASHAQFPPPRPPAGRRRPRQCNKPARPRFEGRRDGRAE